MFSTPVDDLEPEEEIVFPDQPDPNEEQQQAIDDFFSFMLSDETEYHLTGGAGVGKTFTLNIIMNDGMNRYEEACKLVGIEQTIFHMGLTATTNKAAAVLAHATGKPTSTIHSYMGFTVREDYETGETKVSVSNKTVIRKHELIIIDEASMIDYKLYELLKKYTFKCKFLYVGDHCQMAPVFEKKSRIYENQQFFANLKKPMRNAGQPALMDLCQQWRETVETGVFKPLVPVPGVIDLVDDATMEKEVNNTFLQLNPDSRILCFRNEQVRDYNNYIRGLRGLPKWYEDDEVLISASAVTLGEVGISVEQELTVVKNPHIEKKQTVQGVEFDTYELLVKKEYGTPFKVYIPSNYTHFNELVRFFANKKNWTAYFHLKQRYLDLRPKDASTVYKAQGSTYDSVFIDLDDINRCKHADQVARMMYVAVSRPRNRVILYGKLKPAYSGG